MMDSYRSRNFIYKDKYAKKNPEKYDKLYTGNSEESQPGRHIADNVLGGLTSHFNKGLNTLLHLQEEEASRERHDAPRGDSMPHIQLTRRFVAHVLTIFPGPGANVSKCLPMVCWPPD